ncbi:MAG TPA: HAD family phosphatase, partial [Symbiobacteriaceae bacterium]
MAVKPADIHAIIFDLDGLLIDSEPIWTRVETLFLERRGLRYDPELGRQSLGRRVIDVIRFYQEHYGFSGNPEELLNEWIEDYLALTARGIPLRPGADEAVKELSRRYTTAIASSSPRPLIERVVAMFHWTD